MIEVSLGEYRGLIKSFPKQENYFYNPDRRAFVIKQSRESHFLVELVLQ